MQKILLEDVLQDEKPILFEGEGGLNLRFRFAESDVENLNKRTYPHKVLSAAVEAAQKRIDEGASLLGTSDHKAVMGVDDVSHRLISVRMKGKDAAAEAAILKTTKGHNLMAIIQGGAAVGVSMRGVGTVEKNVVQEDFMLQGIDMVLSPSFNTSVSAKNVFESESFSGDEIPEGILWASDILGDLLKDGKLDEATLKRRYEEAVYRAGYRGSFEQFKEVLAPANVDEKALIARYELAVRAGYRKGYREFLKEYLAGRKS